MVGEPALNTGVINKKLKPVPTILLVNEVKFGLKLRGAFSIFVIDKLRFALLPERYFLQEKRCV